MKARFSRPLAAGAVLVGLLSQTSGARAWGSAGHHMISHAGAETLPDTLPAFLRTPAAVVTIEQLGSEADREKAAGGEFDADMDPGHYLDLGNDGKVAGVVDLQALPASRKDYDTALRGANTNEYAMGYLPYSIIDGWRVLANDFALWRVDRVGEAKNAAAGDRAWFAADRLRREAITIHDLGYWSHFVGDGSQPLHVSTEFNGWLEGPNPEGFTTSHATHAHFEGEYVRDNVTLAMVEKAMTPLHECGCTIEQHVARYLRATNANVVPFYRLEKQGAFAAPTVTGVAFTVARVADGASALRDLVAEAYDTSSQTLVGYPERHTVADFEAGRFVPTRKSVGGGD